MYKIVHIPTQAVFHSFILTDLGVDALFDGGTYIEPIEDRPTYASYGMFYTMPEVIIFRDKQIAFNNLELNIIPLKCILIDSIKQTIPVYSISEFDICEVS